MSVHDTSGRVFDDMVLDKVDLQDALLLLTLLVYLPLMLTLPLLCHLAPFQQAADLGCQQREGPLLADRADVAD
jgi:hypothetical protein